jgi:hypothetical protein
MVVQKHRLNRIIVANYQDGSAEVIRKAWKEVLKIEKHVSRVDELQEKIATRETAQKEGTWEHYGTPEPIIVEKSMHLLRN